MVLGVLWWCLLSIDLEWREGEGLGIMCAYFFGVLVVMKKLLGQVGVLAFVVLLVACGAEVGSEKWCGKMENKAKGDWTATEAKDYAKHCVFK